MLAEAGLDPVHWVKSRDPVERLFMQATARHLLGLRAEANKG